MGIAMLVALPVLPAQAATNTLTLDVVSARTEPRAFGGAGVTQGDSIDQFKFLINIDNTGTTGQRNPAPGSGCSPLDAGYPGSCDWPSIHGVPEPSPVYAQGTQDDLAAGLDLPNGRYLISVVADGYKLDGAHFTVPLPDPGLVTVAMQPTPLPDSTLRASVFADVAPTNGTQDPGDQPLPGFVGHIADYLGEVQTDVYGNPLCTTYVGEDPVTHEIPNSDLDADMLPVVDTLGLKCLSDADGIMTIPHLGSNRYALSVTPPDGQTWIQTTTLEGNHDFDAWIMEGSTGYDTEFAVAGEPVPQPIFGFAPPTNDLTGGSGEIKGVVVGIQSYTPPKGGSFNYWGGNTGTKVDHPISRPWLSLADLQSGDAAVYVGRGNADGSFSIPGVPDGNYNLSWWDEPQNYNLNLINVTVSNGEVVDMGNLPLNGWWTSYEGFVFNDKNRNGVKDAGEPGIPNYTLTMRRRENSLMDRGQTVVTTDSTGHYVFKSAYPLGEWVIMEAYSDSFYTTGVTYQADNQPNPTTVKGAGVDVSVLNIIGLSGTMDWGVHAYDPTGANGIDPRNGGIVGTVSYDTTRNELDPQYAASEDWQPGIAGIPVNLYAPVDCGTTSAPCDESGLYELAADGSYAKGGMLNSTVTEHWNRPTGCTARDVDGNPLVLGTDENVLVRNQSTDGECISSFLQSVQFGAYPTDQGTPDANFGAAVDGNYGFGDGCFNGTLDATDPENPVCTGGTFTALPAGEYLVEVAMPNDATGHPLYKPTREEDINIGNGNQIIPQVPPPACAGALHTVDLVGDGTDGYGQIVGDGGVTNDVPVGVTVPASTPTDNATFLDIGGSPYEGTPQPLCDTKLVGLNNGKSIVPMFNMFTDVPLPSRLRGLMVDDINFSTDPRSTMYGEKAGVPFAPVGIYDFTNQLKYTTESDFNGVYDVLMPSTDHISCPTPSGVCANMYRFVANDPGIPGALNPNWNPQYRTIATEFEALPGLIIPTDLAPTQVGVAVESPGTGLTRVQCTLDSATPQLFAVSQPYVNGSGTFSIDGLGFGVSKGTGEVTLDDSIVLPTTSWNNTHIDVTVPAGTAVGPHQLMITSGNGQKTVNGLTFHVLGGAYSPTVYEVGAGKPYAVIQDAIDAAEAANGDDLVVVYPGTPDFSNPRVNPRGAYFENLVITRPIKLQGVGPGGFQGTTPGTFVPGTIIDGSAFGGDTALATAWYDKVGGLTWDGNQNVNDGEVIYILTQDGRFQADYKASIDGIDIRGGAERGFPGNINDLTGGPTGLPPTIVTQGGAIFANAYARHLQITNNVVQNNGSGYGTIRIGTPDLAAGQADQNNDNVRIANNRIITNAGTNLAGGIGIYSGSDSYEVVDNDICGNYSLEYGGGLSVYGRSPNGKIHHNRIYLNMSNDEGGGVMIAGQLPTTPGDLSPGTGPVDIYANQIQANLANDDGGGIRFLMAGNSPMNVYNNMIVNNVSTHEGGGIGLNDAPDVRVFNNTIMKNMTTATAVTSNGQPVPAGLSTSANSDQLQATLPGSAPTFSEPLLFNNIFWDNRAGTRAGTTVTGLGLPGDASPINHWDVGVADGTGVLAPTNSTIQQSAGAHPYTTSATNSTADPQVLMPFDVSVSFATWRQNAAFVDATLVTLEAPPNLMGDYHLPASSPAVDLGANSKAGVNAPADDIDGDGRPFGPAIDSGADEQPGAVPPPPTCPPDCPPPGADPILYFSTQANSSVPGVAAPFDDADIYSWDGAAYARTFDASSFGLAGSADIDASYVVDADTFYMSFNTPTAIPGLGTVQDEDVVLFDAGTWSLYFDGSDVGLTTGAEDVDAFHIQDDGSVVISTSGGGNVPGVGGFADEDLLRCDGTFGASTTCSWSRYFTGSVIGLTASSEDVDGTSVSSGAIFLSTQGNFNTGGLSGQGSDVFACIPEFDPSGAWDDCSSYVMYFDGSVEGITDNIDAFHVPANAPIATPPTVSGVTAAPNPVVSETSVDLTALAATTNAATPVTAAEWFVGTDPGVGGGAAMTLSGTGPWNLSATADISTLGSGSYTLSVRARDSSGTWGPTANTVLVVNRPFPGLFFSTTGNGAIPGVGGPFDDADIYSWDGAAYGRDFNASAVGLPGAADVDGYDRVDANHFYVSFGSNIAVPGLGVVQDEDVLYYDNGTWSVYFDGTAHGLTGAARDIDAITVNGGTLLFSTVGNVNPPGVGGTPDNADIYRWNGTAFDRVWNASGNGISGSANVDGMVRLGANSMYLSFGGSTSLPGLGTVQDEDVVYFDGTSWSVYFDGSVHGLTSNSQDVDAFDVP
jgi:hypothetical protein